MNALDMMNQTMRWTSEFDVEWKAETVYAIYDNNVIIGWCETMQEAEVICEKHHNLKWGNKKKSKVPTACPQLIASLFQN